MTDRRDFLFNFKIEKRGSEITLEPLPDLCYNKKMEIRQKGEEPDGKSHI